MCFAGEALSPEKAVPRLDLSRLSDTALCGMQTAALGIRSA